MANYNRSLLALSFQHSTETVTDGEYLFKCGEISDPLNFFIDDFCFTDATGAPVTATAGTATITAASDRGIYRNINDGVIDATTAPENITPPSGLSRVVTVRVTLSGIAGAYGFSFSLVKGGL